MRPQLKIEKLPLSTDWNDSCDDDLLKETELSQLSFWSEPQQNFLPEWGQLQNRISHFKIIGIVLGLVLSFLSGYFIFRCFSGPSIIAPELNASPKVKIIPAPVLPHKIKVTHEKETQDHAVYHRHEVASEETKVLDDDEESELTTLNDEDLPYTAPTPPKKMQVAAGKAKKHTTSALALPPSTTQPTCVEDGSYYIEIGLFDSHQLALDTWCNLKKDPAKTRSLHEVEPLIEIVGTTQGEQYRLLAGPTTYKEGRLKTQILNSKGYNMKIVGRNS
jgi:hypothetical protein